MDPDPDTVESPGGDHEAARRAYRRWAREVPGTARARSTVRGVLAFQLLANGLGLSVVLIYVTVLFPTGDRTEDGALNLWVFGVYLGMNLLIGLPVNLLLLRRAVVWVREGTEATARQRWLVLRLPILETGTALISWFGGAILFGVINESARRVSIGIALAGIVACTLLYLLLEGHFRPVFALALVDADLPEGRRDVLPRLMLAWVLGSGMPFAVVAVAPLLDSEFDSSRLPWIAAFGILGGCTVMTVAAISVSRPLNRLRAVLRDVELGDLDIHVPVDDLGELGRLAEGINDLVAGLREREQLRDVFGRQVGHAAFAEMGATGGFDAGGELREVTVLFVDLQGYTRFSETHSPEEVVAMLNRFFRVVVAVIDREGGWVNKFEGDAALCVFGAPQEDDDHRSGALRAAAALRRELSRSNELLPAGIGVASGPAIAGFVGTPERFEYTVIGDCVNLAARLCDLAKTQRSGVLSAASTIEGTAVGQDWVDAGRVRIRGRTQRARVWTVPTSRRRR